MLKHYSKEFIIIGLVFGLISYSIYVCAEPVKKETTVSKKETTVSKKETKPAAKPAEVKKEHKKKPTLKAKYANKK
jgi:hypothetical protein